MPTPPAAYVIRADVVNGGRIPRLGLPPTDDAQTGGNSKRRVSSQGDATRLPYLGTSRLVNRVATLRDPKREAKAQACPTACGASAAAAYR